MNSEQHFKICVCLVSWWNLSLLKIVSASFFLFPEILDANYLKFYKSENFLIPLTMEFLKLKIIGFLFFNEK